LKPPDVFFTFATIAAGGWAGEGLGGAAGAVLGGIVGGIVGLFVARYQIRLAVAAPVVVGTLAGGLLGKSIVRALCLPGSCAGAEITAAVLTGAGSLVGVGLVVALVMRSFDEFRESRIESRESRVEDSEAPDE
jgi:hypothetical protein